MVALSARDGTGEMKVLNTMMSSKNKDKACERLEQEDHDQTSQESQAPSPIYASALNLPDPVQKGEATKVIKGGIPVSKPICVPVKSSP